MKKILIALLSLTFLVTAVGLAAAKDDLPKPLMPRALGVKAVEVEPNDDCASANPLTEATDGEITAEDQDWFAVDVQAGAMITFETMVQAGQDPMDTKLYLYADDCTTELAYNDDGGEGYFSLITYTFDTAGTYFVVVTGYSGTTTGFYTLGMDAYVPMPNDTCDGAIDLAEQGLVEFAVDLCEYANDYSPESGGCTGYTANGPDAIYMVELAAGEQMIASVAPLEGVYVDLSVYLVTDCADVNGSCVAGDDSGNPEEIAFTVETAGVYYLIVDTYSGCGEVLVTLDPAVATETATWGDLKSLYR